MKTDEERVSIKLGKIIKDILEHQHALEEEIRRINRRSQVIEKRVAQLQIEAIKWRKQWNS